MWQRLFAALVLAVAANTASAAWQDPSSHEEGTVTVNGVRLEYLDWGGRGRALILIHGLGDNPHVFDDLAPAFTDKFRVIAYARRGSGRSEAKAPYDLATLTEDLRGLMDALQIDQADLAGWSMGGTEITALAAQYPQRVRHVIYLDSYDVSDPEYLVATRAAPASISAALPSDAMASFDAYRAYQHATDFPTLDDMHRVEAWLRESVRIGEDGRLALRMPQEVGKSLTATMLADHRAYASVHCPVLAIFAQSVNDPRAAKTPQRDAAMKWEQRHWVSFRVKAIERMRRELPGAKFLTVRGSHRNFLLTSRAAVVAAMRRFLGADTSPSPLADLDGAIERARADFDQVGAAVAVVRDGETIYARGFGLREAGTAARVDADTLFQIGSTTKAFTATVAGMLVDDGKITWDDPIANHIPGFRLKDPWLTEHVSLRDALAHRSGVLERTYFALSAMDSDTALQQLSYAPIVAPFRDSYRYSNLMYAAAGAVVAAAAGSSWQELIQRRLFQPLGMSRSGTSPYQFWDSRYLAPTFLGTPSRMPHFSDARDDNVAMPHARDEGGSIVVLPWRSYDNAAAAGSIVSSVADLAKWLALQLGDRPELLRQDTLEELHAVQNLHVDAEQFPFESGAETYAMGWRRSEYRGHVHLAHSGGIVGFPAYIALLPETGMGVVVLSNGPRFGDGYAFHKAVAFGVFDRLLGISQRDWRGEFLSLSQRVLAQRQAQEETLRRARLPRAAPSLRLEQYSGLYEDLEGRSGRVAVRIERGQLMLSFAGEGAYAAALEPWHHDGFRLRGRPGVADVLGPQFVEFELDPAGHVGALHLFEATFRRLSELEH
jgi:CubicO group peptidase (beta-lactamase class C family)